MSDDLERRLEDLLEGRGRVSEATLAQALGSIDRLPDRRRRSVSPTVLAAAAVVALAVVALASVFVTPRVPEVAAPSPLVSTAPSTVPPTASPTATLQPRPVWAKDLASHLDCDGPVSSVGMDVPAVPDPLDPGDTPDLALQNILIDYRSLPDSGYTNALIDGHWALHRLIVDGSPKIHIISTNQFPDVPSETRWQVVGLRACDPSEFAVPALGPGGPTIWFDASGKSVPTDVVHSLVGPRHCGWESAVFLILGREGTQYIRDPQHDLEAELVAPFDPDAALPDDAVDTGLHTDRWHLFTVPSSRAVYIRTSDGTYELWPRARSEIGCA